MFSVGGGGGVLKFSELKKNSKRITPNNLLKFVLINLNSPFFNHNTMTVWFKKPIWVEGGFASGSCPFEFFFSGFFRFIFIWITFMAFNYTFCSYWLIIRIFFITWSDCLLSFYFILFITELDFGVVGLVSISIILFFLWFNIFASEKALNFRLVRWNFLLVFACFLALS